MGIDTKKTAKIIIIILLIIGVVFVINTYPFRSRLIMTPSSHDDVEYLDVQNKDLGDNTIEFALYDTEVNVYQICFNGEPTIFSQPDHLKIYVDGRLLEKYSFMKHTTVWKNNTILLINDVETFQEMKIEYSGHESVIRGVKEVT